MSKEQTPIRKLIDEHIEPAWEGAYNADKEALEKDIQEIINAKVLEALEREVPKAVKAGWEMYYKSNFDTPREQSYYETEVKPKYDNTN